MSPVNMSVVLRTRLYNVSYILLHSLLYMIYLYLKRKKWDEIHKMFINI